jgi:C1A family cysteine protease
MDYAFMYAMTNPVMLERDYPYVAKKETCTYEASKGKVTVQTFHDVQHSGSQLKAALNINTVSVAIEADQSAFQLYQDGVITSGCGDRLDHGVLAVGYGTLDGEEYILVKNSWGAGWGDEGYVRIAPTQCGITLSPSYPVTN